VLTNAYGDWRERDPTDSDGRRRHDPDRSGWGCRHGPGRRRRDGIPNAFDQYNNNRRRGGETILQEAFGWMAASDFEHYPGEPLRLATQAEPCSVRSMAWPLVLSLTTYTL